jgi:hypothetical protein
MDGQKYGPGEFRFPYVNITLYSIAAAKLFDAVFRKSHAILVFMWGVPIQV